MFLNYLIFYQLSKMSKTSAKKKKIFENPESIYRTIVAKIQICKNIFLSNQCLQINSLH